MRPTPTKQYSLDGKLIKEYKSLTEATVATGIPQGTIRNAIMYGHVTRRLYKWK